MSTRLTCAASLFALFLWLFVLSACGREPPGPEQQLRAWVTNMQAAAEERDRGAMMDGISTAYADARGNTRDEIDALLRLYFLRAGRLVLLPRIEEVRVFDKTAAHMVLTVGMAGTDDSLLGITADAYRFELELEARGERWELLSARWGELGEDPR